MGLRVASRVMVAVSLLAASASVFGCSSLSSSPPPSRSPSVSLLHAAQDEAAGWLNDALQWDIARRHGWSAERAKLTVGKVVGVYGIVDGSNPARDPWAVLSPEPLSLLYGVLVDGEPTWQFEVASENGRPEIVTVSDKANDWMMARQASDQVSARLGSGTRVKLLTGAWMEVIGRNPGGQMAAVCCRPMFGSDSRLSSKQKAAMESLRPWHVYVGTATVANVLEAAYPIAFEP